MEHILSPVLCYDDCDDMGRPRRASNQLDGCWDAIDTVEKSGVEELGASRGHKEKKKEKTDGFSRVAPRQPPTTRPPLPPACDVPTMKNESRHKRQPQRL